MQRSGLGHRCLRKRMPMAEYVRGDMVADACGELMLGQITQALRAL